MSEKTTKEKIFDVAVDLFSIKGFDAVSIREIARAVGIRESSIYNHYNNKEAILDSILQYFINEMSGESLPLKDIEKYLDKSPELFYQAGSNLYKELIYSEDLLKIFRLAFIEMYHNDKIKIFVKEQIIEAPVYGWTQIFQLMKFKNLIKENSDCEQLAKSYYYHGFYLLVEHFVFNYPEKNNKFLDEFFNEMNTHMELLLAAVKV